MKAYRITKERYAVLLASGYPGRWNSAGVYVIYAGEHRSLSILENIAHNPTIPILERYVTLVIDIPDDIKTQTLEPSQLPTGWNRRDQHAKGVCQMIGDEFVSSQDAAVLRVPSAIVPQEYNLVISASHPDFTRISVATTERFEFDPRIVSRESDQDREPDETEENGPVLVS